MTQELIKKNFYKKRTSVELKLRTIFRIIGKGIFPINTIRRLLPINIVKSTVRKENDAN